jgi:hypothetical protein
MIKGHLTRREGDWPFPHSTAPHFDASGQAFALVLLILVVPWLNGCVNASLAAARARLSEGQYAAAHQQLMVAASQPQRLSARERREVLDDLCLTEFKIGAPSHSLAGQQRACARAVSQPGSNSGPTLVQIDAAQRAALAAEVTNALKANDAIDAEDAVTRYRSIPGADPQVVAGWSRQIWITLNRRDGLAQKRSGHQLDAAISQLARAYPQMKEMNDSAFRHWVLDNASVDGARMVSRVQTRRNAVDVWVPDERLPTVALNLNRFAQINDALVARCRCDGRTNIAVAGTGLPAYLLRLDPETHRSEVLILPRPRDTP